MIPLSKPFIDENDISAVVDVLKSGRLALGPKAKELEMMFSKLIGTRFAIAVSSGTSGLHLCIKACDINPGDEIITSPFSFIASANCIVYEGGKPVFVDIEEDTFNMNTELISEKITDKTKAILPVHIFGQCCNMDKIMNISKERGLLVIEDACESLGAEYKGRKAGSFGDAAVFAF